MKNKIRHVHIPKTAGSSLNSLIYQALDMTPNHISKILDTQDLASIDPYILTRKSQAYKYAQNNEYLSGHVSFYDMKSLKGNFIFTVTRDPRQRLISVYTYLMSRKLKKQILINPFPYDNLLQFINSNFYNNGIFKFLCKDYTTATNFDLKKFSNNLDYQYSIIEKALSRFNAIYYCPIQNILDDLNERGFIPKTLEISINKSLENIELGNLGLNNSFLEKINKATQLDSLVNKISSNIYPLTAIKSDLSNEELIKYLEDRFNCKFSREF